MRTLMATTPSPFSLDSHGQTTVNLWQAASLRLAAGHEYDDVLVQAAGQAVVAWLMQDAPTPGALLGAFSRPGRPLLSQLRFVGSLVHDPSQAVPAEPPPLWWWVVADAYYRRWLEFTPSTTGRPPDVAS